MTSIKWWHVPGNPLKGISKILRGITLRHLPEDWILLPTHTKLLYLGTTGKIYQKILLKGVKQTYLQEVMVSINQRWNGS